MRGYCGCFHSLLYLKTVGQKLFWAHQDTCIYSVVCFCDVIGIGWSEDVNVYILKSSCQIVLRKMVPVSTPSFWKFECTGNMKNSWKMKWEGMFIFMQKILTYMHCFFIKCIYHALLWESSCTWLSKNIPNKISLSFSFHFPQTFWGVLVFVCFLGWNFATSRLA